MVVFDGIEVMYMFMNWFDFVVFVVFGIYLFVMIGDVDLYDLVLCVLV